MSERHPRDPGPDTPVGRAVITALSKVPLTNTRPTRVVLMYSGGLDSVALLANLLSATDHEIHVHHIVLDNGERRAGAENQAVAATYEWCRAHLRPFDTSESGHTFPPGGGAGGWDTTLTMFTAARVTRWLWESPIDVIVTGHIRSGFRELAEGETVFHAALQSRRRRDPEWVRPLARLTGTTQAERKADIARSIPPDLVERSWWCRRPVEVDSAWVPCDGCHACKSMAAADGILTRRAMAPENDQ